MPGGQAMVAAPGLLRFVLALAVVYSHLTALQCGRAAVLLFFLLSGYWISLLWAQSHGTGRVLQFVLNRFLRIWPLYVFALMVCGLMLDRLVEPADLLLIGVASQTGSAPIGVEWSLDVEAQFYLAMPILALALGRLEMRGFACLAMALGLAGWLLWMETGVVTFLKYLPVFAVGMVIHHTGYRPGLRSARISLYAFLATTPAILLAPTIQGFGGIDQDILAMFWIAPLIPYVAASLRHSSDAPDRALGDLSYPLYLFHVPLLVLLTPVLAMPDSMLMPCMLALILLGSLVVYRLIDRPIERVRRAILARAADSDAPDRSALTGEKSQPARTPPRTSPPSVVPYSDCSASNGSYR